MKVRLLFTPVWYTNPAGKLAEQHATPAYMQIGHAE